ncbi:cytochrome c oxidase subunit 5b-1, mitochondrial-like [Chenopodium quinoa]|uniref:cytochrome c oxidase subunit 5b-1, mitochondrial-like n=1 Tax=Chenopodium quinoa TaxID=63459 RepID=UPI000B781A24|nr:cytochrome c oxidase subunit 5b-1, mitochondrial-like [Chenopodium quinoa]
MWRRLVFSNLKILSSSSSSAIVRPSFSSLAHRLLAASSVVRSSSFLLSRRHFSVDAVSKAQSKVEDAMPIVTGHEREELEAETNVILNLSL